MKKRYFVGINYGNSMWPIINHGNKLSIEKAKLSGISLGDIVIFYHRSKLISHRVIKKNSEKLLTKGDNSPFFDVWIKESLIVGKLVKIEGPNGIINLDSKVAHFLKYYFLFYSLSTYYAPRLAYLIVSSLLRGRRILTQFLRRSHSKR